MSKRELRNEVKQTMNDKWWDEASVTRLQNQAMTVGLIIGILVGFGIGVSI